MESFILWSPEKIKDSFLSTENNASLVEPSNLGVLIFTTYFLQSISVFPHVFFFIDYQGLRSKIESSIDLPQVERSFNFLAW